MKDVERSLRESLTRSAESFVPGDVDAAERRFLQRRGRRRMIRAGGAAAFATAGMVALFVLIQPDAVRDGERRPQPAGLQLTQRFEVPEEPLAIAGGPSGIWVASREAGTVTRIDPTNGATQEVPLEGASEIAVGDANAWAGGSEGHTLRIDAQTIEVTGELTNNARAPIVDMAVGGHELGAAWALDAGGCLLDLTDPGPNHDCINPPDFRATDVATAPNETWLLDGETGVLEQFHAGPGVNDDRAVADGDAPIPTAPTGPYGDLLVTTGGNDALWISGEGGQLMRLDLVTGEQVVTQLDGDYADLAAGYYSVWALVGHEGSDRGELVAIDVVTGKPVGKSYALAGKPSDLYAGTDGVWVTLRGSNEVVRITDPGRAPVPVESAKPTPSPESDELSDPLGPDELVMVFSGRGSGQGELFTMFGDGRTELISAPSEAYVYPSFTQPLYSDGPALVVERRNLETLESELVYVDIFSGAEESLVPGLFPAISRDGRLAYQPPVDENPTLVVADIGTDFSNQLDLDGVARSIEWDGDGRFVYVELSAGHEDVRVLSYDSTGELGAVALDPGPNARYLAPSSRRQDSVHLIRIETEGAAGAIAGIELVEVEEVGLDSADTYSTIVSLNGFAIDEQASLSENLRLEATGRLDASVERDGTIRWGLGEGRSWILGFRSQAWLVKESGEVVDLGEFAGGGIAVSPELLER